MSNSRRVVKEDFPSLPPLFPQPLPLIQVERVNTHNPLKDWNLNLRRWRDVGRVWGLVVVTGL
ncbi:hypothetical protein D9613_003875 [Agrocybe pediades]|uniref:Uncharacterized protein n=1 Tax=Agrocybe pediades TaxID=84607 RepID=A0A8H4QEU8_9AGAR|nr:hypothetical protein D9613_012244 [Agrocybe pediades]KAF4612178.1 hypothetical protein D9613_003875 [Agrocybe pediades]